MVILKRTHQFMVKMIATETMGTTEMMGMTKMTEMMGTTETMGMMETMEKDLSISRFEHRLSNLSSYVELPSRIP